VEALLIAKEQGKKLGEVLVELGYTTEESIANALSRQLNIEVISLSGVQISEDVLKFVSGSVLRGHMMVPIEYNENNTNRVRVAMADPMDMLALDDFFIITNLQAEPVSATPHDILVMLDKNFGDSETMQAAQRYAKEKTIHEEPDV